MARTSWVIVIFDTLLKIAIFICRGEGISWATDGEVRSTHDSPFGASLKIVFVNVLVPEKLTSPAVFMNGIHHHG
jgi:hypothetical protein